jgi:DNA-binding NarL/FixJ family response regulator
MSLRTTNLTSLQLEVVNHLANGLIYSEIATAVSRSEANVKYHANQARLKCGARTLPQLVSVVIAQGFLDWNGTQREVIELHAAPESDGSSEVQRTGT